MNQHMNKLNDSIPFSSEKFSEVAVREMAEKFSEISLRNLKNCFYVVQLLKGNRIKTPSYTF